MASIPSFQVHINRGRLDALGAATNVPTSAVQCDMVLAAETLRRNPGLMIRIDAKRFVDLQAYLRNSGHVK